MFAVTMPPDFKLAETRLVTINDERRTVTWNDPDTLLLDDRLRAVLISVAGERRTFYCADRMEAPQ